MESLGLDCAGRSLRGRGQGAAADGDERRARSSDWECDWECEEGKEVIYEEEEGKGGENRFLEDPGTGRLDCGWSSSSSAVRAGGQAEREMGG